MLRPQQGTTTVHTVHNVRNVPVCRKFRTDGRSDGGLIADGRGPRARRADARLRTVVGRFADGWTHTKTPVVTEVWTMRTMRTVVPLPLFSPLDGATRLSPANGAFRRAGRGSAKRSEPGRGRAPLADVVRAAFAHLPVCRVFVGRGGVGIPRWDGR